MKKVLSCVILVCLVTFCWIGLEYVLDGKVTSQYSDTVFAIALAYFINEFLYDRNILKQ